MARRYSGDVELRLDYDDEEDEYVATIRSPKEKGTARVTAREIGRGGIFSSPTDPEAYDLAAEAAILAAEKELGQALPVEHGPRRELVIRRTFQAPCPVLTPPPRRRTTTRRRGGNNRGKRT